MSRTHFIQSFSNANLFRGLFNILDHIDAKKPEVPLVYKKDKRTCFDAPPRSLKICKTFRTESRPFRIGLPAIDL